MSPGTDGKWSERVIHSFGASGDGLYPSGSLTLDAAGNLYGTTPASSDDGCDGSGCGLVFRLTPTAGGQWKETVLHNFGKGGPDDGAGPQANLIFDSAGNLYGTTMGGGANGRGTVFELTPTDSGEWTEKVLHSFDFHDGSAPLCGLLLDSAGNLYGTTVDGGAYVVGGTVFEITQ
ncbi:MAG: choice-of-anchor tandem repeat GloVer-containing protein [Candidatus Sulfotelmatobacter sp.]